MTLYGAVSLPHPHDVGADDGDDDGDVVFAILWNAWSLGCALYNATRRLHLLSGFIRPICRKRICRARRLLHCIAVARAWCSQDS